MGIDQAEFRRVMSHFLSGVTVVTTAWGGRLYGITVSSFTSLSLDPTLVLVSIDRSARSHAAIVEAGRFAVNFLAEGQQDVSIRFAARDGGQKFEETPYRLGALGLPLLDDTLGYVECNLVNTLPGGDHTIFVGEVVAADAGDGSPLGYYRSQYHRVMTID